MQRDWIQAFLTYQYEVYYSTCSDRKGKEIQNNFTFIKERSQCSGNGDDMERVRCIPTYEWHFKRSKVST